MSPQSCLDVESQRREWRRLPRKAQMAIIGILGILTVNKVNLNFKLNLKHSAIHLRSDPKRIYALFVNVSWLWLTYFNTVSIGSSALQRIQ